MATSGTEWILNILNILNSLCVSEQKGLDLAYRGEVSYL